MKKAKKLIAGIMLACMVIVGAGVKPPDVFAAATTTAAAGSLEMKTASDSINLNAGQSFDVTFSVNAETSGFGGYLTYDNSVFTSVTVVVDGGTTSGKTDNNGEWKASYNGYTHFLSVDYYKKDALVATITTDETGVAKLTDLPLGKYYVKEKETANGYVLDGETREVDLTYRDQNTAEVTYSADWQNKRQKAEVKVLKKAKDSDRVLEGAVFALCNKDDIVNAKGDVILKADTVIEEQATDKDGKLTFTADLPLGHTYYVKETSPAQGFATTDQVQEFTFEYGGAEKETLSYEFTFEDEATTVEFTKTSLTDGKEIEGAKLKVTDESGNTVDEWTSGKEPHIIKELTVGKKYTMTETLPADGYVTAESITFTVEDTSEVQKVEMKDDVTKVQISKTDISGKELPGAKLTILDKDGKTVESWTSEKKPHYIEMLPIGEYILREETAPDGYLVAEDVKFTVKDTGEIQKVVMKDEAKPEETPTETPTETPETTPTPETKTTEETKKSTSPKTGDNTPILFWILLAGAGMAGLGGTVILRKKKK